MNDILDETYLILKINFVTEKIYEKFINLPICKKSIHSNEFPSFEDKMLQSSYIA
jgi:hypothetical protein